MWKRLVSYAAAEGAAKAANWLTLIVLPLVLSPVEYGLVGLLAALEAVGTEFFLLGQDRAILRFMPQSKRPGRLLLLAAVNVSVLGGLLVGMGLLAAIVSPTLRLFSIPVFPHLLALGFGVMFLVQTRLRLAYARSERRVGAYAAIRVSQGFGKLLLVVALAWWLRSAGAYPLGLFVAGAASWTLALLLLPLPGSGGYERGAAARLLRFGGPLVVHVAAGGILTFLDRFMLERMVDTSTVGLYTLAYTIGGSVAFVHLIASVAIEPEIYRRAHSPRTREPILGGFTLAALAVGSAVGGGILLLSQALVRTFGSGYEGLPILVGPILAGYLLLPIYLQGNWRLISFDATSVLAVATAVAAASNIGLNWLLIPEHGALGAAWATFASYLLLVGFTFAASLLRSDLPLAAVRKGPYLGFAALALCAVAATENLAVRLLLLLTLVLVSAVGFGLLLRGGRNSGCDPLLAADTFSAPDEG